MLSFPSGGQSKPPPHKRASRTLAHTPPHTDTHLTPRPHPRPKRIQPPTRQVGTQVCFTVRDPAPADLYGCPVVGIGYGAFTDDVEVTGPGS
jgi:hypothetical protein